MLVVNDKEAYSDMNTSHGDRKKLTEGSQNRSLKTRKQKQIATSPLQALLSDGGVTHHPWEKDSHYRSVERVSVTDLLHRLVSTPRTAPVRP